MCVRVCVCVRMCVRGKGNEVCETMHSSGHMCACEGVCMRCACVKACVKACVLGMRRCVCEVCM